MTAREPTPFPAAPTWQQQEQAKNDGPMTFAQADAILAEQRRTNALLVQMLTKLGTRLP